MSAGVIHQDIFEDIRWVLLRVEGAFRSFDGKVDRSDHGVLSAFSDAVAKHPDTETALNSFRDNAIFNKGNSKLKKGGGRPPAAAVPPDFEADPNGEQGEHPVAGEDWIGRHASSCKSASLRVLSESVCSQ